MNIVAAATTLNHVASILNTLFFFFTPELIDTAVNFRTLGLGMAAISFGLIGLLMAGSAFFGEAAEQAKRTWLPTTIQGLILIGITTFFMTILGSAIE